MEKTIATGANDKRNGAVKTRILDRVKDWLSRKGGQDELSTVSPKFNIVSLYRAVGVPFTGEDMGNEIARMKVEAGGVFALPGRNGKKEPE